MESAHSVFEKAAATSSLPSFFSHAKKGAALDDILDGELGGLDDDDNGGLYEELEIVDEVEHLDSNEDFDAALAATGLAQFTQKMPEGEVSYGAMLDEPDDGGFDFESMLQDSTGVLGGLGLDNPLFDLQDNAEEHASPGSTEVPAGNVWTLPSGSSVIKTKGAGSGTSRAIAGVGRKGQDNNNAGKSLLSVLKGGAGTQSPAPPAQQQQKQQPVVMPASENAWARDPPQGSPQPLPGQMLSVPVGPNGIPLHPRMNMMPGPQNHPPLPPGMIMGPRGPMSLPGGPEIPPLGMGPGGHMPGIPSQMMGPGGPGAPLPFTPLAPGAPLPPGFPPNFHELPPNVKANIHGQYHRHMMMLGAGPVGQTGQVPNQGGSQPETTASATKVPETTASATKVTESPFGTDPTPAELAQMEKDGIDTRQTNAEAIRPGQPTLAGGRGGRGGRGPSRAAQNKQNSNARGVATTVAARTNVDGATNAAGNTNTDGDEAQKFQKRPRRVYPKGEMMSSQDVKFVTDKVMNPLRFTDPYTQDFYYLQNGIKKNAKMREKATKEGLPMPAMIMVPQPLWRDFKERIRNTLANQRDKLANKSKKWEEREQVLGHLQRTNVSQPRELLSVPTMEEVSKDSEDGEITTPFASKLWQMRSQVQRGYEALSTVKELNTLIRSSNVAADPGALDEILYEVERAVSNLASAVGIQVQANNKAHGPYGPPGSQSSYNQGQEVMLDGSLVAALLQSAKGKKLMSRSMNLLRPDQRWALLPVIAARILQTDPKNQSAEDLDVESRLLKTMLQFIQHSQQFQAAQQLQASAEHAAHPFSMELLGNLKKCIKGVMVAHMEKQALRGALLSSRHRAVLLNTAVKVGDKVRMEVLEATEDGSSSQREPVVHAVEEWVQIREAFMSMLDSATAQ